MQRITFEQFNEFLDIIKSVQEKEAAFNEAMNPFNESWCVFNFAPIDEMSKWLSDIVGDKAGWVSWFIYECEWGNKPKGYTLKEGGKSRRMKTRKQLWKVLNGK